MKNLLVLSVLLNILFISASVFFVHKKGGVRYIKRVTMLMKNKKSVKPQLIDVLETPDWRIRKSVFDILPTGENDIIFLGNSITEGCEWAELLQNTNIKNRGIGGDNTVGVIKRLDDVLKSKPLAIFLEIGINDLRLPVTPDIVISNYDSLLTHIKSNSPQTKIFAQSVLPVSDTERASNSSINAFNAMLEELCSIKNVMFIDLNNPFKIKNSLNPELTFDGLHLNGKGYLLWVKILQPFLSSI